MRKLAARGSVWCVWYLLGGAEEDESEVDDRGPPDVVGHVGHGHVEQPPDGRVVVGARVGQADGEHGPIAQDGVAVSGEGLDERLGVVLQAVVHQGDGHGQPADDLLVRSVVGVAGLHKASHKETMSEGSGAVLRR